MARGVVLCSLLLLSLIVFSSFANASSESESRREVPKAARHAMIIVGNAPGETLDVVVMIHRGKKHESGTVSCEDEGKHELWIQSFTGGSPLTIALEKLSTRAGCRSEVVVLSENHRMHLEAVMWTENREEIHTVNLSPALKVPVSIWVVDSMANIRARDEISNANLLYRKNRVGVQFDPTFHDKWSDPNAVSKIEAGISTEGCTDAISTLRDSGYYTHSTLNVYYVKNYNKRGRNCAIKQTPEFGWCPPAPGELKKGDGNITYMGTAINLATLAHELGHAFGLRPAPCWGHTSVGGMNRPGFDDNNIMRADGSPMRNYFSLGQVFRLNTQNDEWGGTMLIQNNLRPRTDHRACPPMMPPSDMCPGLAVGWQQ